MQLNDTERHILIHTLTGSRHDGEVYRNFYAASAGHDNSPALHGLVEKGLMVRGKPYEDGFYYHCTEAGAAAIKVRLPEAG